MMEMFKRKRKFFVSYAWKSGDGLSAGMSCVEQAGKISMYTIVSWKEWLDNDLRIKHLVSDPQVIITFYKELEE